MSPLGHKWRPGGSAHNDLILDLGGDQEIGIDIAALEPVGLGEQITSGQVLLGGGVYDAVWQGYRRRDHLRDESGVVDITGVGEVDLTVDPVSVPYTTLADLQIVGGVEAQR